ncbi:hypothetical protein GCM10023310_69430 [Paenibacillus vulneris]|uniref:DUF444 family protein n=1 Tax=Paenibacillus vulneris TaxID=1133364 RepID=A0ABW3UGR9_9BACL
MEFKTYSNKQLLNEFAITYGLSVFDKSLKEEVNKLKQEILNRMKRNTVTTESLQNSLVDELVIIENKDVDIVFQSLKDKLNNITPQTKNKSATIISIIDSSGSMGSFEKYMSQCVSTWSEKLLELKYENVKHRYISHHTEAQEVRRDVFFSKCDTGGTIISSGLSKANELINRVGYEHEDIYLFQYSDGDNLTSDNETCNRFVKDILNKVILFEYVEINQFRRSSTIMTAYRKIQQDNFHINVLQSKEDVLKTVTNISNALLF